MRVDGLRDASPGVTQYHLDAHVINPGRVEHAGQRVAALVGRVVHADGLHGAIPEPPERIIRSTWAYLPGCLPFFQQADYPLADGDFPHPGGRL
ncbi:hypothetical protein ACT01_05855 [Megasphaera hexanoica]|nr:hypothetical protein ACT01_05855 [Megasphaera hexanoica]